MFKWFVGLFKISNFGFLSSIFVSVNCVFCLLDNLLIGIFYILLLNLKLFKIVFIFDL